MTFLEMVVWSAAFVAFMLFLSVFIAEIVVSDDASCGQYISEFTKYRRG